MLAEHLLMNPVQSFQSQNTMIEETMPKDAAQLHQQESPEKTSPSPAS
jgi:hypothetical protein